MTMINAIANYQPMALNKSPPPTNGDINDAEMDSPSDAGSDSGAEINGIDADKLDQSHREILEKLKRQEAEEREEIERELQEAQKDALERVRRHEEMRGNDMRPGSAPLVPSPLSGRGHAGLPPTPREDHKDESSDHTGAPSPPNSSGIESPEIKTQRPLGLLAQHGLMTKAYNPLLALNPAMFDRERDRDRMSQTAALDFYAHAQHLAQQAAANASQHLPAHPFMPFGAPDRFLPAHVTPPSSPHTNDSDGGAPSGSPNHHWTFEEQFKQLYEMSDDVKRKEFLDELFSYMQKRGTPVNRIPIMAKQTLDLYELFRLVVSKGGLVEVINKKLWREITKGLNLPSSITSAAFTLRTQYMKYLYPFECEKLKLSSPAELQSAIDGNRREGRRPSYDYNFTPMPNFMSPHHHHLNGGLSGAGLPGSGLPGSGLPGGLPASLAAGLPGNMPGGFSGLPGGMPVSLATGLPCGPPPHVAGGFHGMPGGPLGHLGPMGMIPNGRPANSGSPGSDDDMNSLPMTPPHIRSMAERDARAMEAATKAMEEATKRIEEAAKSQATTPNSTTHSTGHSGMHTPTSGSHPPMPMFNGRPERMDRREFNPVSRENRENCIIDSRGHSGRNTPNVDVIDREREREKERKRERDATERRDFDDVRSERLSDREALKERTRPEENTQIKTEEPPAKKLDHGEREEHRHLPLFPIGVPPSTHIKINSRGDGRHESDSSLVVSMEINGTMYQGVLFAQNPRRL